MSIAIQPTKFIPVEVTSDWISANNVAIDLAGVLGATFPGVFRFPSDYGFVVSFLYGKATGVIGIWPNTTPRTGLWFSTAVVPTIGDSVYIVDIE